MKVKEKANEPEAARQEGRFSYSHSVNEKGAVLAALQERCDAMVNIDMDALDRLIDDKIVIRHTNGKEETKAEWLAQIENEQMRYYSVTIESSVVEVDGDTASIRYTSVLDARIYGSRGTWRLNSEAYFVKQNGAWLWTGSTRPRT